MLEFLFLNYYRQIYMSSDNEKRRSYNLCTRIISKTYISVLPRKSTLCVKQIARVII